MTTLTLTPDLDAAELRGQVAGDVVFPGDPGWDEARLAWNLAADQRPGVVVYAESAEDVAAVVTSRGCAATAWRRRGPGTTPRASVSSTRRRSCSRPSGCGASRSTRGPRACAPPPA